MTKQFKDYPADLQRIVELTHKSGWCDSAKFVYFSNCAQWVAKCISNAITTSSVPLYTRTEYEQCRAAYLYETAGDIKAGEVDWRGLVITMLQALEHAHDALADEESEVDAFGIIGQIEKARAALEASE